MEANPTVVVVGGGFGGLYAARALARRGMRVVLLDRVNYHLFQPLLYQVATAALSPGEIAEPLRAILRKYRKVEVLLGYADRFPPFSQDLYLVRQTASEYLPRTINAFLAMPLETVDQPLAMTGRTARDELKAQLDLLDSKLDEIAQDLQRQDADRLLANRRFLESRFSEHRGDSPLQGSASGGVA